MALHNGDRNRTIGNRLDPRNSQGYLPWIIGAIMVAAAIFFFMGGTFADRTTTPPTISDPQTVPK